MPLPPVGGRTSTPLQTTQPSHGQSYAVQRATEDEPPCLTCSPESHSVPSGRTWFAWRANAARSLGLGGTRGSRSAGEGHHDGSHGRSRPPARNRNASAPIGGDFREIKFMCKFSADAVNGGAPPAPKPEIRVNVRTLASAPLYEVEIVPPGGNQEVLRSRPRVGPVLLGAARHHEGGPSAGRTEVDRAPRDRRIGLGARRSVRRHRRHRRCLRRSERPRWRSWRTVAVEAGRRKDVQAAA